MATVKLVLIFSIFTHTHADQHTHTQNNTQAHKFDAPVSEEIKYNIFKDVDTHKHILQNKKFNISQFYDKDTPMVLWKTDTAQFVWPLHSFETTKCLHTCDVRTKNCFLFHPFKDVLTECEDKPRCSESLPPTPLLMMNEDKCEAAAEGPVFDAAPINYLKPFQGITFKYESKQTCESGSKTGEVHIFVKCHRSETNFETVPDSIDCVRRFILSHPSGCIAATFAPSHTITSADVLGVRNTHPGETYTGSHAHAYLDNPVYNNHPPNTPESLRGPLSTLSNFKSPPVSDATHTHKISEKNAPPPFVAWAPNRAAPLAAHHAQYKWHINTPTVKNDEAPYPWRFTGRTESFNGVEYKEYESVNQQHDHVYVWKKSQPNNSAFIRRFSIFSVFVVCVFLFVDYYRSGATIKVRRWPIMGRIIRTFEYIFKMSKNDDEHVRRSLIDEFTPMSYSYDSVSSVYGTKTFAKQPNTRDCFTYFIPPN